MLKEICLVTFVVCLSSAERISHQESPTWNSNRRTTTEDYGYGSSGYGRDRDRSPSFGDGDEVTYRPYGSSGVFTTHRPGHVTWSWERDGASGGSPTRSSYLGSHTTRPPYVSGSSYDYDRDDAYGGRGTSRRPSFGTVTDKWGDVVSGSGSSSGRDSPYDRQTTDRWGSSGSSYDRTTPRYGGSGDYVIGGRYTTTRYGSGGGYGITTRSWLDRDSIHGSGHGSSGSAHFNRNEAYIRIKAELVKLTNTKGFTSTGSKCDTFGECDTTCYAFLDTERPNAEFPGSRDTKYWPKIFETDDNNSPTFSKAVVTKDVCGVPYRDATLRVKCDDKDSIGASDLINNFDCKITEDAANSEFIATWHSGECVPKFQKDKMRLTFRYQIFVVSRAQCDPHTGDITTPRTTTRRSG